MVRVDETPGCRALTAHVRQDVVVAPSTQLNATEQDTLVKQIGLSLLRAAPRDWRRITAQYRAVGRYHELTGEIVLADGGTQEWVATHDIATLFGRLRTGMYREGRGTWFNARYQLDHPSSYNLEYDREEPEWGLAPPPQAYADELRMFPRSEENVPDWLMRRMAGLGPERPGPRFRIARIFDSTDAEGRPVTDRPELEGEEQDRLLDYLDSAPVVISGRGYDVDHLANPPESRVPIAFHSDGTWIWPAAVNYYLHEYGLTPEPDLIQHIRATGFSVPDVPDSVREAAAAHLSRGGPPPQRPAPPAAAEPEPSEVTAPGAAEPVPPDERADEDRFDESPAERTRIAEPVRHDDLDQHQDEGLDHHEDPGHDKPAHEVRERLATAASDDHDQPTTFHPLPHPDSGPPTAITSPPPPLSQRIAQDPSGEQAEHVPSAPEPEMTEERPTDEQPPLPLADEPVVNELQNLLVDLGVPESVYRLGGPTEYGWALEEVPEGWRVGWYDGALTSPAVFGDVEDAAAFMLGKLLLASAGTEKDRPAPPQQPQQPQQLPPVPDERPVSPPPDAASAPRSPAAEPAVSAAQAAHAPAPRARSETSSRRAPEGARQDNGRPASEQGGGQQWPIHPLPGEPPLTLFRGKELQELPIGSELDRFGDPNGNLTYAAGTPFEERSLVPEWVNRPYHVYRVQRPLETLAGVAIPWFNQPGGGAAYVLPASIEELLATGDLIELDPGEPPID